MPQEGLWTGGLGSEKRLFIYPGLVSFPGGVFTVFMGGTYRYSSVHPSIIIPRQESGDTQCLAVLLMYQTLRKLWNDQTEWRREFHILSHDKPLKEISLWRKEVSLEPWKLPSEFWSFCPVGGRGWDFSVSMVGRGKEPSREVAVMAVTRV